MNQNVAFFIEVYNSYRTHCAFLSKRMELPFTPFIGLELDYTEIKGYAPVKRVHWVAKKQEFHCAMAEPITDDIDAYLRGKPELLIEALKKQGWEGDGRMLDLRLFT